MLQKHPYVPGCIPERLKSLKDGEYAMISGTALTSFREFYQKGGWNLFYVSKKSLGLLKDQENKVMLFGESYVR